MVLRLSLNHGGNSLKWPQSISPAGADYAPLYSIASRLIGKHMVSIWTLPTIYTQELLAQKPARPPRPLDNPKGRAEWYLLGNSQQTSHAKPGEHPININPQQSRSAGVFVHSFDKAAPPSSLVSDKQEKKKIIIIKKNPTTSAIQYVWIKMRTDYSTDIEVYGE